ncbi:TetR/AcrR family transcriptional regulator [Aestuariirhabdus litorea]|uniref:TetR/AcrR family transcriptional regulator n=1 Tax=Aestuariirhabdus litorea TaxID=2528527 RepID=A0A3P3VPW4_9GAMM|nr:TetR/AcrR family transcriptional regulator [Aestuariirhabdus litorea]RRJ84660.1 TetR/AcrR family transcriptional regulator [Aestuariirhabdus litorea]RWW97884.1 TetR family transcriptional regulator [Endozoicomonadaceae bacterium GTF-13]
MAQSKTVVRILDAAEQLFAEKGFSETSLRTITGQAGVNLAAVNYHFGSKKALIQAVFARFLDPFCALLDAELERVEQQGSLDSANVEEHLKLLVDTLLRVESRSENDLSVFMRLLGLAFSQSQGHLRRYMRETYSGVFNRYMRLLTASTPNLTPAELYWRVNFMLGSLAFTMSGFSAMQAISERDYNEKPSVATILYRMVPFLASGLRH